jgi:chromosome segregation ATPase
VAEYPIGLFPAADYHDPEWTLRVEHYAHLLGNSVGDTVRMMVRFMNAQLRLQELQHRGIIHLASEAQITHSKLDRNIAQVEELQAAVTARDEMIAQHEETIGHREDQITENDALLSQHNIVIEYLLEQVQDLTLELNDANDYIEFLQVPPVPPEIPEPPAGNEEEDPEEIEGVSELDSEHEGLEPEAQNSDLSLGSESSVGNLDNF